MTSPDPSPTKPDSDQTHQTFAGVLDDHSGYIGRAALLFFLTGGTFFALGLLDRALLLLGFFSQLVLMVFLSWLVAFLVLPLVDTAHRRLPIKRSVAVVLVYLGISAAAGGFIFMAASLGAAQVADLIGRNHEAIGRIDAMLRQIQSSINLDPSVLNLSAAFAQLQASIQPALTNALSSSFGALATTTVGVLGAGFVTIVLSVYAVIDADNIVATLTRVVPNRYAAELGLVQRSVSRAFRGFLLTQAVLIALQVILNIVVSLIFGLPFVFTTSALAGLAMSIPFFGPIFALLPPVFVALGFRPEVALPVLVVLFLAQTILLNLVQPRLMQKSVGLHPILVVLALLVGAQVAGLWGALFGIPVAAVLSLLVKYTINLRAVSEVDEVNVKDVLDEMRETDPEATIEVAAEVAADRADEVLRTEADTDSAEQGHGPATPEP
jgi:predicted PurR-regulated permease PerM